MRAVECPDPEVLSAFGRGRLGERERSALEHHFDGCTSCSRVVADLVRIFATHSPAGAIAADDDSSIPSSVNTLRDDGAVPPHRPLLVAGARLDRYHILGVVGRGGMGVVYSAYDPDLDRKVALKVLHESDPPTDDQAQRRLLREAQAMARLSHPNVITVHEARVADGRVFLSMEFVEGGTLGTWIRDRKPELPRLLAMLRDVGRGLAAAHAAGLVHRDVKPDNVLVGADDRPRVTDFGLARPADDAAVIAHVVESLPEHIGERALLEGTLTRAGTLAGTPAYMSPEQLTRDPATAASDQFSFCVLVYEALYGVRPFAGRSLFELATNVVSGKLTEPERDAGVLRSLRQVVLRGLSLRPEDRWPSMAELVAHLELPHPYRRLRWVGGATVVGATVAIVLTVRGDATPHDPCEQGDRIVDELWTSGARADVRAALAKGGDDYAETTATLVVERLDAYVERWAASHRDACEDYHRGGQSFEALDLRGACLDERLREVQALLDVLGDADAEVQRHAVEAVDGMPPLAECDDLQALRTRVALPDDPAMRARVVEIEQARAQVEAQLRAGLYDAGLARADELVDAAREVGHAPSTARALRERALFRRKQGRGGEAAEDLHEAWLLALGSGDDAVAADCMVALASLLATERRFDEAALRAEDAAAVIERVRRHDPLRAEDLGASLDGARGEIELRQHHYEEAVALYERSLAAIERRAGRDSLRAAQALNSLASVRLPQGRGEDALALFGSVLAIRTELLGPAHPETAMTHNNLGLTLKNLGRLEEAEAELDRARTLVGAALGASHPMAKIAEVNLADVYYLQARHAEAADLYATAFGIAGATTAANRHEVERAVHYATSAAKSGRGEEARELLEISRGRVRALDLAGMGATIAQLEADIQSAAAVPLQ
jgi:tetratricopeptide (TPR) repeat protein/predicted Ser/Thr protein kinase